MPCDLKNRIISRPNPYTLPDWKLPFFPRSCGETVSMLDTETHDGGEKTFVQINWCTAGCGRVAVGGCDEFVVRPGDVFYSLPGNSRKNAGTEAPWKLRWLTFDGESARAFMESYRIPHHPIAAGRCPERLFDEFEQGLHVRTVFAWRKMVALVCDILAHAVECREPEPQAEKIAEIAMERCRLYHSDPAFNVNALAEQLQLSRVTLFRIFRVALGVTPSEYIAELRCGHALELIRGTSLPMREVAARSGFADRTYFFRVIRKRFNASPRELRTRRAGGRTLLPE